MLYGQEKEVASDREEWEERQQELEVRMADAAEECAALGRQVQQVNDATHRLHQEKSDLQASLDNFT